MSQSVSLIAARGQVFALLVDLLTVGRQSALEKDLEVVLLRQQLRLLQRRQRPAPRLARWEKLALAVVADKLARLASAGLARLRRSVLVVQPETVMKWHRELVRRNWRFKRRQASGRPRVAPEIEAVILRLAAENPRWGYSRIHGELGKLGVTVSRSAVRDTLNPTVALVLSSSRLSVPLHRLPYIIPGRDEDSGATPGVQSWGSVNARSELTAVVHARILAGEHSRPECERIRP